MKNKLCVAAAVAVMALGLGRAQALTIDGTWSATGSGAVSGGVPGFTTAPPDPVSVSATFSFSTGTTLSAVSISDFTTNFGATSAQFNYFASDDQLDLFFYDSISDGLSLTFDSVSTHPTLANSIGWLPVGGATAFYSTQSGSFTPASSSIATPAPPSLVLLATGLIGLCAFMRRRIRTSRNTPGARPLDAIPA